MNPTSLSYLSIGASLAFAHNLEAANQYFDTVTGTPAWDGTANWSNTGSTGTFNQAWTAYNSAHFQGTAGTVTVSGSQLANFLDFDVTGYTLTGGTIGIGNPGSQAIRVNGAGLEAIINSTISSPYNTTYFTGVGTLKLGGTGNSFTGLRHDAGTLDFTGGTTTVSGTYVANNNTTTPVTFNISGGSVTFNGNTFTTANNSGSPGSATINQTGGSFNHTNPGGVWICNWGGTTTLNLSGGTFTAAGDMYLGVRGSGILNISDSASVTLGKVLFAHPSTGGGVNTRLDMNGGVLNVNSLVRNNGTAVLNLNGGTLKPTATTTTFMQGLTSANVKSNGASIDTGDFDITIGQALLDGSGGGGLTKSGNGMLTLTGASTYTGATNINAGSLILSGAGSISNSAEIVVAPAATLQGGTFGTGQTVRGTGTLAGAVTINSGATLSPAGPATIGTLTVTNNLTLAGTTVVNIDKTGATRTSDQIIGDGMVSLGGSLTVTATGDTLALGDTFTLLANTGGRTGVFASAGYTLPTLPPGLFWDKSKLPTDGTITVTNVSVPDVAGTPLFSPVSGNYAGSQVASVTLTADSGSTIYYTVDGTNPTSSSPSALSPATITTVPVNATDYTIKAFARKSGLTDSAIATAVYNAVPTPTWNVNEDGLWSESAKWLKGVIPDGVGVAADFSVIPQSASAIVDLDGDRTVGSLKFSSTDPTTWSLTSVDNHIITLATASSSPTIEVAEGTTTISARLTGSQGLTKTGGGTLQLNGASTLGGSIAINAGTLVSTNTNKLGTGPVTIDATATYSFTTTGTNLPTLPNTFAGAGTAVVNASSGNQPYYSGDWSGFSGTLEVLHAYQVNGNNHGSPNMKLRLTNNSNTYLGLFEGATSAVTYQAGELSGDVGTVINTGTSVGGVITLEVGALGTDSTFAGRIVNSYNGGTNSVIGLTKSGTGTLTLSGANTYLGGTIVNAGTLELASGGTLAFRPGANGVSNRITGTGTLTLDGAFNLTLTAANLTPGNSWNLVDVNALDEEYGESFAVNGFTEASGVWTRIEGVNQWTFTEADGNLTLSTAAGYTSWAATNAGGQGPDLDHDGDGVKNGIEYFMGQTGSSFTALPGPVTSAGATTVTWTRDPAAPVTSFAVQFSTTLGNDWAPVPGSEVNLSDPTKVIYTFPAPLTGKRFVRLSVTP